MKLAVIFNGQGAHYQGMGQDFVQNYPAAEKIYALAESVTGQPLRDWIKNDIQRLSQTRYSQPTIAATSLAIYESIKNELPAITYMAGLSLGEYSALMASGMISLREGFLLIKQRGEIMSEHCRSLSEHMATQMAAVIDIPIDETIKLIESIHSEDTPLYAANFNSPKQIVIAGSANGIKIFRQKAKESGYRKVIPLKVEGPFHTPLMEDVKEPFASDIEKIHITQADTEVISNVSVGVHQPETVKQELLEHFTQPVKWCQTVEKLKAEKITHIIQVGPGDTLTKLIDKKDNFEVLVIDKTEDAAKLASFLTKGGI